MVLLAVAAFFPAVAGAEVLPVNEYDISLSGQTQIGPSPGGVGLGDEMSYVLTLSNRSGVAVPAGGAIITASVNRSGQRNASRIASTGLNGGGFSINNGGDCAVGNVGRAIRCVNSVEIAPGAGIELEIYYTHVQDEDAQLVFFAQASLNNGAFDPVATNNAFGGAAYTFADNGTTTTTTIEPTTTTVEPTTSTTEEETTTTEEETTTTVEETTTTETPTPETTVPTTVAPTTEAPTTVTTVPTTVDPATDSTLETRAEGDSSGVLGATGTASDASPPDAEVSLEPLAPTAESGGFPLLPLAAVAVLGLLIAGATVAYYRLSDDDPPLVDIRQYH